MSKYDGTEPNLGELVAQDVGLLKQIAEALSLKYPFGSYEWQQLNAVYLECENRAMRLRAEYMFGFARSDK
ncbi:hypothetical protein [Paenibacillus hexagrammi]|uniref:Uncharacterized protein n=1 Tax=Paenibacillus hexagrammi TaxID=2908839 RepID=A0ABY3ST74_9BACL|nr:hypothetical protein [Paenibacillus sp. YPD9-1]UJF36613.1 hypothetical protein L0M14_30455 [Paenibacillus sp. YPD9-1]